MQTATEAKKGNSRAITINLDYIIPRLALEFPRIINPAKFQRQTGKQHPLIEVSGKNLNFAELDLIAELLCIKHHYVHIP